ncbi:MAG: hypothetical protein AVDCRST_MAG56-6287 [uncultured Cytophagales bacterium]|uniref:Uncharacterized protein n=1 Tax=uncultured Cytophagales bacterium TaxID=158755 RepID=A0A6J4KUQ6_9SPHI|nr:MAG: hypothetical protein AVDCRST_MAG56-6287 [uncultured Cytophagales bacterium]
MNTSMHCRIHSHPHQISLNHNHHNKSVYHPPNPKPLAL